MAVYSRHLCNDLRCAHDEIRGNIVDMDIEKQLQAASAVRAELERLHTQFMGAIGKLDWPHNSIVFKVERNELRCSCLGIWMFAQHRLVARNGQFFGIEYIFAAEDDTLPIWTMYLMTNGILYTDSMARNVICAMSSDEFGWRVGNPIASALMASDFVAPRE